jgi:hypothetical protein
VFLLRLAELHAQRLGLARDANRSCTLPINELHCCLRCAKGPTSNQSSQDAMEKVVTLV